MPRKLPSLERLNELFNYDPETGLLTRKCHIKRSHVYEGDVVGTPNNDGHLICRVDYQFCYVHRIGWKMHNKKEPPPQLDHKNRVKTDNWIDNLRPATTKQNSRNRSVSRNSLSGVIGVRFSKKNPANKWKVGIKADGKEIHLGYFTELEKAIEVRLAAEKLYFKDFAQSGG